MMISISAVVWYLYEWIFPKLPVKVMLLLFYIPGQKWWAEKVWKHNLKVAGIE